MISAASASITFVLIIQVERRRKVFASQARQTVLLLCARCCLNDAVWMDLESADSLLIRFTGCFWNVNSSATTSLDSDDGDGDREHVFGAL